MIIRAGYAIAFECSAVTPMILHLNIHPSRAGDLISPDVVRTEPDCPTDAYLDLFGNRVTRVEAPVGVVTFHNDFTIRDSGAPDETPEDAPLTPVGRLPNEVLVYLLASRYCDSDNLSDFAWSQFAGIGGGARLVQTSKPLAGQSLSEAHGMPKPAHARMLQKPAVHIVPGPNDVQSPAVVHAMPSARALLHEPGACEVNWSVAALHVPWSSLHWIAALNWGSHP